MTPLIAIIEDETKLADLLTDYLRQAGFDTLWIRDGGDALASIQKHNPNVVLLDWMLPNKDGLSLCREIRQFSNVPIIMTTAKVDEIDRLLGLEMGSDDYVCKPYSPREVVARVKAILRRHSTTPDAAAASPDTATPDDFILEPEFLRASHQQQQITLTAVEFALIQCLFNAKGAICSREQLMSHMYPDGRIVSDRTIDSHIKKLRKKLHEHWPDSDWIQSVYGVGYRWEAPKH